MKRLLSMMLCAWACLAFAQANAQPTTLFSENFQSGGYPAWTMSGDGHDSPNYYAGNWSMRLDGLRQGTIALSTQGYQNVSLSMQLAALYLVTVEYCRAEVSTDGGSTWTTVVNVIPSQADGAMRTGTLSTGLDDKPDLRLRFRAYALYYRYCYGDNIVLTGTPIASAPQIEVSGSGSFGNVAVGDDATNTLTLANAGDANLVLGALGGLSAPFALVNDTCSAQTLAPSASCTVDVRFAPTATGSYNGTLAIPSNDPLDPNFALAVSGTGTATATVYDPLSGNGSVARTQLGHAFLTGSGTLSLMNFSHYAVPAAAANPVNVFQGRLTLTAANGNIAKVGGSANVSAFAQANRLPDFSFDFIQHGTHFIPVTRGKIDGTHPSWSLVLEPGRVWNENGDNGYSRVAFPFTLQEQGADCMWNGVMSFLFKDDGSVSSLAYQIASETCLYFKANFWGKLAASYTPAAIPGAAAIVAAYEDEVARRMPVKPIAALATDYPGSGVNVASIGSDITAAHMTIYGVAHNGVHYVGGCQTRQGTHPFCETLNVPSYSTAKSVMGGYGLMRLEQKYAGTQGALEVRSWVGECSASQWTNTPRPTFEHLLDMATGNYTSAGYHVDEGSTAMTNNYFLQTTHAAKVAHACGYTRKVNPGTQFVYHTSDTYLLGRAMNQYYKSQAGSGADFFDDVLVDEIFAPLGLSPTTHTTLRTKDATAQPYFGQGLIYVRDDVVKLARFLNTAQGTIGGNQVLDAGMVSATLNLGTGGLPAWSGATTDKYNNGFWYYDIKAESVYGCGSTSKWVPYMSGFGGISVVLLPNGMIYYQFSDNDEHAWSTSTRELAKIAPLCP